MRSKAFSIDFVITILGILNYLTNPDFPIILVNTSCLYSKIK